MKTEARLRENLAKESAEGMILRRLRLLGLIYYPAAQGVIATADLLGNPFPHLTLDCFTGE
jgi:hypothetical protein